jgi:2-hydroxy-3-oxopropionate reductase
MGLALPHTASAQQLFSVCVANGGKAWDHSGLVRALEIMSNFKVAEEPVEAAKAA